MTLVERIREELERRVDDDYRVGCRNFFKEQVNPLGVRSKDLKEVEAIAYRELKAFSRVQRYEVFEDWWRSGSLEEGAMVCHLARRWKREFAKPEFKTFARWIDEYVSNWAHADGVATWLLAGCIENDPVLRDAPLKWAKSKNRWKRRCAAVSFLQEAKKGQSIDNIFEIASRLEKDLDPMVQKGVGWLLKEAYPKRPEEVLEFVRLRQFPRLVTRYAAEKMTKSDRAELGLR